MWDGLVDLQVNGFAGVDFNDARIDAAAMAHALRAMRATGVGTCLPTVITATEAELSARLAALDAAVAGCGLEGMVPGWHLEGPFLNPAPAYAGCHPPAAMVMPDVRLLERLERGLRRPVLLLTLAPELPGAEDVIRWARARGKIVALGHTGADADAVARAVAAGAQMSTHLGNAMSGPVHKFLNPMMAQLAEDGLVAGFIADGVHIPPAALRVMLRAKGLPRSILVSDATSAAGTGPGLYEFAGMRIEHAADGSVRVPGEAGLAGSALRLDVAVRNLIGWGLASEAEAVAMARENPMRLLAQAVAAHGG
jgi:N-acetylglucosamine-6-phosphate deacetylase